MKPEIARRAETVLRADLAALDAARADLLARFPDGLEAGIAGYREWLRTELTYTSNAIEGSTMTAIETRMVLEDDAVIPDRSLREHLEARDHAIAWDYAVDVLQPHPRITATDLLAIHERVLHSTNQREAGIFRRGRIRVAGSQTVFPNPLKVPDLIDALVIDINEGTAHLHPVIHAALVHLDFVKIHPFTDGNGRVGRILMNLLPRRAGYPAVSILPSDRLAYLNAIEQADNDDGAAFCMFLASCAALAVDSVLSDEPETNFGR